MSKLGTLASPMSRDAIRAFALSLRDAFGMKNNPFTDIGKIIEFVLPQVFEGYEFLVKTQNEMGNNHGLTSPDERRIILREDVYNGLCLGKGRDRFTASHEVGHLLLHANGRVMLSRSNAEPIRYCDPEWQADCFAGEFLMPFDVVRNFRSAAQIAAECRVSDMAAQVQWRIMQPKK